MKRKPELNLWYVLLLVWGIFVVNSVWLGLASTETISYSQFLAYVDSGRVEEVSIGKDRITGRLKDPEKGKPRSFVTGRVDADLVRLLSEHKVKFAGAPEDGFLSGLIGWILPFVFMVVIWSFMLRSMAGRDGLGGGIMSVGKSRARVYMEEQIKVSFADVAGVDEAKEELKEVVSFLKEPKRYARLGGRLPKGILLVGPPGSGKTLLARAVAGEAGVPFFSISGSEFVEMFVGVGAARVRDLFAEAQKKAPCIIFIDELDALGRARGIAAPGGGHEEKEQTLNQLLVELDGFDPRQGVVLLAATNRPEILDPALLRAGRFDRHILVDRPDKAGRVQILNVHMKDITADPAVDRDELAALTPGFTGADIANLVNEAALLATRRGADSVAMADFQSAIERIVAGLEKKNRLLNKREREVVAHHEMGHTIVALALPGSDPVQKVSIIPRGIGALGFTMQRPTEDRYLMSRAELENKMTVLLGGRAAEFIIFHDVSTGAADDLSRATEIARSMVSRYGMNERLGPVAYESETNPYLSGALAGQARLFSEKTASAIDDEIKGLVEQAFRRAVGILTRNMQALKDGAALLLDKETLTRDELPAVASESGTAKSSHPV